MRSEELRELSDLNYAEAMRELARRCGGAVHDEGGVMVYASAHPLPVLTNGAMRTGPEASPAEVIDRARAFFAPRGRGFSIIIRAHADEDLRLAAAAAGLTQFGEAPGMVLDHRLADAVAAAGVTLRRVATLDDAVAFGVLMDSAYASLGMPGGVAPAQFARLEALVAPHIVAFVAEIDGTAAAGAMTIVSHGVAGIYWVGTSPAARGRGLAELCTRAAGNAGFDLGARIAALQASVMGDPIYRRMGYVEVTRYPTMVQFDAPR
ncbi:MAG: GNAT family N-acetyltransferase [Candidatus Binatia bacterium]